MKKHLLFILAALLPLVTNAHDFEVRGIYYNITSESDKTAEVTYKGDSYYSKEYSGSITIPATIGHNGVGYSVTSIGEYAFYGCTSLTAINITEGVTSIGRNAFCDCSSLAAINILEGSQLTSIGDGAFYYCRSLTTINIPEGSQLTSIGNEAFRGCSSLTAITLPEGVTSIRESAFNGCSRLTAITLPEGVTSIGERAFYGCSGLAAITIPEGVTSIGIRAFMYCSSLTAINIPEDSQLTSIGNNAFDGCTSLTAINIPEGVTSIEYAAFKNCTNLTSITIPEGVTEIGEHAFYGTAWYNNQPDGLIYINNVLYEYKGEMPENTSIDVREGTVSISSCAFNRYSNLTAITIPEGVTSIGSYAFQYCSSLTAINIPEDSQLTSIGNEAFYNCTSLTSINIPEGSQLTSIGNDAFRGCSSLTTINLPEGVTSIGSYAFLGCSSLTDVYCYAEKVPSTDSDVFYNSNIENATLHVLASALETYKTTAPWSSFGKFETTSIAVESITLSQSSATLLVEESLTLTATVAPDNATDKTLTWSSSNPSVATVDNTGKVTAIASGTATIAATANDGSGVSAQCEVTVEAATYVTITINQYGSGTYCSEYALDFSNVEGLKAYAATGYDTETGVVTLTRVMTAKAGVGLFIKGEPGEYRVPVIENTSYNTLNMLVGTLTNTAVNATSGDGLYANYKYTIKEGNSQPLFYRLTDGSTLGAGKAYLQIPMAWLPQTSEAKSISLRFDEGEGTTEMENSQFTIDNSQLIYDLYGRRVDNPVKGGIYIVGGRKVVY